eukprot:scaffold50516_cov56-Phaeocystis_antarctica.AAC.1
MEIIEAGALQIDRETRGLDQSSLRAPGEAIVSRTIASDDTVSLRKGRPASSPTTVPWLSPQALLRAANSSADHRSAPRRALDAVTQVRTREAHARPGSMPSRPTLHTTYSYTLLLYTLLLHTTPKYCSSTYYQALTPNSRRLYLPSRAVTPTSRGRRKA